MTNLRNNKLIAITTKNGIRYYPTWVEPSSKFSVSTATTERKVTEYHNNLDENVKSFKDREESINDKIKLEFDECKSAEDAKRIADSLEREAKSISAKYIEEIKEDSVEFKKEVIESSYIPEAKKRELDRIDKHLEEHIQDEGKSLSKSLEQIRKEYENEMDFYESGYTESDAENSSNQSYNGHEPLNKNNNENKNPQTPIDYVLEKESCNMPSIPDSDGGE